MKESHRIRATRIEAERPQRLALEGSRVDVDPRVEQKIDFEPAKEHAPHASAAFLKNLRNSDIGPRRAFADGSRTAITMVTQLISPGGTS
jgi:hypothetical protein